MGHMCWPLDIGGSALKAPSAGAPSNKKTPGRARSGWFAWRDGLANVLRARHVVRLTWR